MSGALVLVLEPNANFTIKRLPGGQDGADLEALQKIVGGYIEAVTDAEKFGHIYINEEGKLMALQENLVATAILNSYIPGFAQHDRLAGNVVWLDSDEEGDSADIRPDTLDHILLWILDNRRTWVRVTTGSNLPELYDDGKEARLNVRALAKRARQDADFGEIKVEVSP